VAGGLGDHFRNLTYCDIGFVWSEHGLRLFISDSTEHLVDFDLKLGVALDERLLNWGAALLELASGEGTLGFDVVPQLLVAVALQSILNASFNLACLLSQLLVDWLNHIRLNLL